MRVAAILFTLVVVSHTPMLWNSFVYEDVNMFETQVSPLTLRPSRWLQNATWVNSPRLMHLSGFGLHLAVTALVGVLVLRLGFATWWLSAGIVGLHPLHTEAVAYAADRSELFIAVGVLVACISITYLGWKAVIGCIAGLTMAMLGKESGVIAVALVLLTMCFTTGWRREGTLILIVAACVLETSWQFLWAFFKLGDSPNVQPTLLHWMQLQTAATWKMLGLLLWPKGLSVEHAYSASRVSSLALLPLLAWCYRSRLAWFGLAWMLISLVPRFLVRISLSVLPEHQFYLAMIGASISLSVLMLAVNDFFTMEVACVEN